MAEHNILGERGEYEACRYLAHKGYTLHERNWRTSHLELDIVAEWYGEIVFVEVKTRHDEHFAEAKDAVTLRKKRNLVLAAREYLSAHGIDKPFRFDVITVVGAAPPFRITHYPYAYTPAGVADELRRRRLR